MPQEWIPNWSSGKGPTSCWGYLGEWGQYEERGKEGEVGEVRWGEVGRVKGGEL